MKIKRLLLLLLCFTGSLIDLCNGQVINQVNLGPHINTPFPELQPRISMCGKILYFVRTAPTDRNNTANTKKKFDQEIWRTEFKGVSWEKPSKLPYPINTKANDGVCTVLPGNQSLLLNGKYFTDSARHLGVSITTFEQGNWRFPENLLIPGLVSKNDFANFYMAATGQYLILELYNDSGLGKQDLYVCFKDANGRWSSPRNLGPTINSPYHDFAPFLAADNQTLYFASNRPGGMGNADIWMSRRLDNDWQKWTPPVNLGKSVNTEYFEAYFSTTALGDIAYCAADLENNGNTDIISFPLPPTFRPKPVIYFKGKILFPSNANNNEIKKATVTIKDINNNAFVSVFQDADSNFSAILPPDSKYELSAEAPGYISSKLVVTTQSLTQYKELKKEFHLLPILANNTLALPKVEFENDSRQIKQNNLSEINECINILRQNPKTKLYIQVLQDSVYLSGKKHKKIYQKRTETVLNNFIMRGIQAERIILPQYQTYLAQERKK
jgi:outer membrane protein OmpA-like peptidoglycan-associated protein